MDQFISVISMMGTFLLMVLIFVGAYYASKFVGKGFSVQKQMSQNGFEIIQRIALSKDHYLMTVKLANKAYLIGVTPQQIMKIDDLDPEMLPKAEEQVTVKQDFFQLLKSIQRKEGGSHHEK